MFAEIIHCDWSKNPRGRWMASARRGVKGRWHASGPRNVPLAADLLQDLQSRATHGAVLAAFDFPIGVPASFGAAAGFATFGELLDGFGRGEWPEFFDVAVRADEVSLKRPFYPCKSGGTRREHLLAGHGVETIDALVRACERAGPDSGTAGCMFWTLGAKQVGKAMLHGWREIVIPAREAGARLWPFDGDLADLAAKGGLVLAESYPGDAYGQIGLSFKGRSKRNIDHRRELAAPLLRWASLHGIALDAGLAGALEAGFPAEAGADDGFDAVIGLLAAIAVAEGARAAAPPVTHDMRRWEGWILGKRPA